jgi:hypothetical protein
MKVLMEYVPIMTADWNQYAEELTISELKAEDDFLVYFEQIVQKAKDNKTISTTTETLNSRCIGQPSLILLYRVKIKQHMI